MVIFHKRQRRNFTVVANSLIDDSTLSSDARVALIYLFSKPANWELLPLVVAKQLGWGRDKLYRVLRELIRRGFIVRYQERDPASQNFGSVRYDVYADRLDNSQAQFVRETPLPDPPCPENPHIRRSTESKQIFRRGKAKPTVALPKTQSRNPPQSADREPPNADGALLQHEIARRLMPKGSLAERYAMLPTDPVELEVLCQKQAQGTLSEQDLQELRLRKLAKSLEGSR